MNEEIKINEFDNDNNTIPSNPESPMKEVNPLPKNILQSKLRPLLFLLLIIIIGMFIGIIVNLLA